MANPCGDDLAGGEVRPGRDRKRFD